MRISFIGAGKVGKALGLYFQMHGLTVQGYASKSHQSAEEAAELTHSQVFSNLRELALNSDLILITTPDDAISEVANQLANSGGLQTHLMVAHTSGALSSQELGVLEEKGCSVYSVHPLQAFKEPLLACKTLQSTSFSIEGTPSKIDVIEGIFTATHNPVVRIEPGNKTLYHAGACVVSNYLVTLMDVGFRLFEQAGMKPEEIYQAVSPLIMGTLENIQNFGPENALTGPIVRGDIQTVSKHLKEMKEKAISELALYRLLGLRTLEMIQENPKENYQQIKQLLEGN